MDERPLVIGPTPLLFSLNITLHLIIHNFFLCCPWSHPHYSCDYHSICKITDGIHLKWFLFNDWFYFHLIYTFCPPHTFNKTCIRTSNLTGSCSFHWLLRRTQGSQEIMKTITCLILLFTGEFSTSILPIYPLLY